MIQYQPGFASCRPGLLRALALASALAACGGSSASRMDDEPNDQASEQQDLNEAAGIEPAASSPAPDAPAPGPIDAPPNGVRDQDTPAPPLPTEVQVTNDRVQLGAGVGLISSPLFVARSPLGTTLDVVEASDRICLRGELGAVPDGDYTNYWGGEVGLVLGSSPPEDLAASGEGLLASAFSFRLTGALPPPQLRLRVAAAGEVPLTSQYCQNVPTDGDESVEIVLQSLTFECWTGNGAPYPVDASATLLSWQLPASIEVGSQFDFCIEDIRAVP